MYICAMKVDNLLRDRTDKSTWKPDTTVVTAGNDFHVVADIWGHIHKGSYSFAYHFLELNAGAHYFVHSPPTSVYYAASFTVEDNGRFFPKSGNGTIPRVNFIRFMSLVPCYNSPSNPQPLRDFNDGTYLEAKMENLTLYPHSGEPVPWSDAMINQAWSIQNANIDSIIIGGSGSNINPSFFDYIKIHHRYDLYGTANAE